MKGLVPAHGAAAQALTEDRWSAFLMGKKPFNVIDGQLTGCLLPPQKKTDNPPAVDLLGFLHIVMTTQNFSNLVQQLHLRNWTEYSFTFNNEATNIKICGNGKDKTSIWRALWCDQCHKVRISIMKQKISIIIIYIFLSTLAFGQDISQYSELIKEAVDYYEKGEFLKSGQKYSEAFLSLGNKENAVDRYNAERNIVDRYNAACSWALANELDSAFAQLFKIAKAGLIIPYNHLIKDPQLNSLHDDPRWDEIKVIVKANEEKAEANLDKELVAILEKIYEEDQKFRMKINEIEQKYGRKSEEMKAHWKIINEKDSINLIKVKKILDERGWLGSDIIGEKGNTTLFLVIQHSDIETQIKYLPIMRDAVKKGNARPSDLALLEDRILLRQGKKQIYGSQIGRNQETGEHYVLPLKDPENVDKRRSAVGLGPLQNYVVHFGITWNIEEYIKKLPEIDAQQKN